jgi:uncharacterized iron-regulated membrane protein
VNPATELETNLTKAQAPPKPAGRAIASTSLYRVVWRWHFYAGVIVSPVLLVVSVTGALYTFRSEIEDYAHSNLRFVSPTASRLSAQSQLDAAQAVQPGQIPAALELSADPARTTVVRFGQGKSKAGINVHVDPYRGVVVGSVVPGEPDDLATFFDATLKLHRQLFLGTTGRLVVELCVGWTIILLASGLYLWWPKKIGQALGVWRPRLRAKPYVILRDLHSVAGFYMLVPAFIIAVTGLFYALVWGEAFYQVTRDRTHPARSPAGAKPDLAKIRDRPALSLDRIETLASARYPGRNIEIAMPREPGGGYAIRAGNDYNRSYGPFVSAQFTLDPVDGTVLNHKTLAEDERYWWHGWVYPLHVGSILGPATKAIWLLASLILAALPVTGLWMWLVRRPIGRTGFPRRPGQPIPRGLILTIVILALAMPVVGASIFLIVGGERLFAVLARIPIQKAPLLRIKG